MPSPVPWILLTVEVRSLSKGEKDLLYKFLAHADSVILYPDLIQFTALYCPWYCLIRTETVPPAGVNFTALDKRFSSTWFSRVLSQ